MHTWSAKGIRTVELIVSNEAKMVTEIKTDFINVESNFTDRSAGTPTSRK